MAKADTLRGGLSKKILIKRNMDILNLKIDKFTCGEEIGEAQAALSKMLEDENIGTSYADMMRYRVANRAANECNDTYYVAHQNATAYSRLWNGWGKHADAIGNFGNFVTVEELRGRGIGHKMLELWYDDLTSRANKPLCLLCMGEKRAAKLYFPYGFTTIEKDAAYGPLFMPIGDAPKDFIEFCDVYYRPSDLLIRKPATVEWRHEIDCLLKYSLRAIGLDHTINGRILEQALLYTPEKAELLFTECGRCVGWMLDGERSVHPKYERSDIVYP